MIETTFAGLDLSDHDGRRQYEERIRAACDRLSDRALFHLAKESNTREKNTRSETVSAIIEARIKARLKTHFPNGLPRQIGGWDERDGIRYVPTENGDMPILSEHRLTVEWWNQYHSEEWTEREFDHPDAPRVKKFYSDWKNTPEEALAAAVRAQDELEEGGEYAPIYIRY